MNALGKYLIGACCLLSLGQGFAQDYHLRLKKIGGLRKATIVQGDSIGFSVKPASFLAYSESDHKYFAAAYDPFPEAKWYLQKVDSDFVELNRAGEFQYDTVLRGVNKPKYDTYKIGEWEICERIGSDIMIIRKRLRTDTLKIYLKDFDALHVNNLGDTMYAGVLLGSSLTILGFSAIVYPLSNRHKYKKVNDYSTPLFVGGVSLAGGIAALISSRRKVSDFYLSHWRISADKNEE